MPKPRKTSLYKRCTSLPNSGHKRRSSHTSATTGPKTRSSRPYNLRSSSRPCSLYLMDDLKIVRERELWLGGLEEILIEILYQETLEGKLQGSKIQNRDIVRIAARLSAETTKSVDSNQVRGKITRLKQKQRDFTNLMAQTGMGWNPTTKTVVASDEHWARALQVRSQWRKFKLNGCPEYEQLCTIFGQSIAITALHFVSTQEPLSSDKERRFEEDVRRRGPILGSGGRPGINVDQMDISVSIGSQTAQPRHRRRRRREVGPSTMSLELSNALESFAKSAKKKNEIDMAMLSNKKSKGDASSDSHTSVTKIQQCVQWLQDVVPPIPPLLFNRALKLFLDPQIQEMFLTLNKERRLDWVCSLE